MVSWQQGKNNLFEYMDWIHSCRVIISHDSLGLHMAFAFGKEAIGLFGPTDPKEIYFYDGGHVVSSLQECSLRPCLATRCGNGLKCMDKVDLTRVEEIVHSIFRSPQKTQTNPRGAGYSEKPLASKVQEGIPTAYGLP
jgi:heptosyltransferase-2